MSNAATDLAAALHGMGISWNAIEQACDIAGLQCIPRVHDSDGEGFDYYHVFDENEEQERENVLHDAKFFLRKTFEAEHESYRRKRVIDGLSAKLARVEEVAEYFADLPGAYHDGVRVGECVLLAIKDETPDWLREDLDRNIPRD